MAKDIDALLYDADLIHDAETESFNSAERVGQMFIDIIEHLRDVSDHNGSGGTGGDVPSGQYGSLISSLWTRSNPGSLAEGETGKILEWNGSAWQYSSTPTGGGGTPGTGGLAWSDLAANDGALPSTKQIDGSHLLSALSGYLPISELTKQDSKFTWWGQRMQNISGSYIVKGAMINVDSLTFTNGIKLTPESSNGQYYLKLSYAGNGTDTAHFYATGGVSALGMGSVSPGGGGSGVELTGILKHISENDDNNAESISPQQGATIRWGGTSQKWVIDKTAITDIAGISAPASTGYLKATVSGNNISYTWENITPGTGSIEKLSNVGDVTTNPYPTSSTNDTGVLAWLTGQHLWGYLKFNVAGTGTGTTRTLSSIIFADTTYNVPSYTIASLMGSSSIGTNKKPIYWNGSQFAPIDHTIETNVPANAVFTDHIYTNGNGLNLDSNTGAFSVKAASGGGLAVDSAGIKIDPNTNKRVLWGNDDKLTNDIGSDITFDYGRGIQAYTTSNNTNAVTLLRLSHNSDSTHELDLGYGSTVSYGVTTQIYGVDVDFFTADVDSNGNVVKNAQNNTVVSHTASFLRGGGLAIGNGVLKWDSDSNALYVQKIDGTAANFYATGGVSALGFSNGVSSIDAMTFGVVDITSSLKIKLGNTNNKATIYTNTGTGLIINNPYGGIFINDSATYINDTAGDTYFGGDENTNGGKIYICLASQGYEYYRLDVDKLHRDGYLTLD